MSAASPEGTRRLAARLGRLARPGDVIALVGELGAGKTTFVTGLAEGLGVPRETRVQSPTFTLVNVHQGRLPLYHIDLYRIAEATELDELGLHEYLGGAGLCAVEWFDRFPEVAPAGCLEVGFELDGERGRRLTITPHGAVAAQRAREWLDERRRPRQPAEAHRQTKGTTGARRAR
ncbi:MAG: tRNA (adenosine(37)-N6)-threonylcarbamoyltransferase complex ATPase subunit type 1 TsaE [Deltaproteobacteria bacterium]|nr:tRNA (adenosine(37)-N6)-threonylcarbamoyltransferase complex ATPase subunit type 1 TsaE [Deltaproteobacteria bacterium]